MVCNVVDPDPGTGAFLTPESGMGIEIKIRDSESRMNIPDHISESLETILGLKILTFPDPDPEFF
jgi:hypothetical protein